jgi:hypothetical protein
VSFPLAICSGVSLLRSSPEESSEEETTATSSLSEPLLRFLPLLLVRFLLVLCRLPEQLLLELLLELLLRVRFFFFFRLSRREPVCRGPSAVSAFLSPALQPENS